MMELEQRPTHLPVRDLTGDSDLEDLGGLVSRSKQFGG
jgi:hypothetical protein